MFTTCRLIHNIFCAFSSLPSNQFKIDNGDGGDDELLCLMVN